MALLAVAYVVKPGAPLIVALIAGISVAAVITGVRRYRPARAAAWLLLAAALALAGAARVTYELLPGPSGTLKHGIWVVWLMHLVMAVLVVLGLLHLTERRRWNRAAVIDVAIILLGASLLLGVMVALPYASAPGIGPLWAGVRVAYVVRDAIFLALAAYVAVAVRRSLSVVLLEIGLLSLLVYDVIFRVGRIHNAWLAGTAIDLLWLLFLGSMGAAALVAPMVGLGGAAPPAGTISRSGARVRLGLVMAVALVPSLLLLAGMVDPPRWHQVLLALASSAMMILAFARVVDINERLREQADGERAVREAAADLADAPDDPGVVDRVARAVGRLLGTRLDYAVALAAPPAPNHAARRPRTRVPTPVGAPEIYDTTRLPATVAADLGGPGPTLALPLNPASAGEADDHASAVAGTTTATMAGDRRFLYVRADRRTLERQHSRLLAIATQAGLALQRIALRDENLRTSREAYFRTLVQKSTDVIVIIDDDNRIRFATPSAASLVGPTPLTGRSLLDLIDQTDRDVVGQRLAAVRAGAPASPVERGDWTVHLNGGPPTVVEVACRDLRADRSISGLVLTMRNVTEQRRLEHELADRAFHDPLTGLSNRLPFSEELDRAIEAQRDRDTDAGVLYIDLDDLKLINDSRGHATGDGVLVAVGERLRAFVAAQHGPPSNMAARLGGDEFAVLLTDISDRALAAAANDLTYRLAEPVRIAGEEIPCAASIGVATSRDAADAQELLRVADLALYSAKNTGKRQWSRFEPWMHTTLMARMRLRASLEQALRNDEFVLEYQPIVDLARGTTVGFEALLRWQHPTRGRLAPDEFIDVAEESGLIAPIGAWVVATAVGAARRWPHNEDDQGPYVAINVSARQFGSRQFADTFQRLLAASGLPPQRVLLEITESLLLREDDDVWRDLQRLRELGVRIAIDDFGTGYSALSYLRRVPLDIVKLDRSFLQSINASTQQRELVRGIAGLARTLDLQVVAEGIETDDERLAAREVGCDYGQGYYFSRPLPEGSATEWLRERQPADVARRDRRAAIATA